MSLTILAANNATTVLASGISSAATSLTVASGSGSRFPSPVSGASYFKLTLIDAATESLNEIVHVTAVSGDTFTIIRGQEGTAARSWSVSDIAANMVTAGTISALAQYDTPPFIAATTGRLINIQVITSSGNYIPTEGATFAEYIITGAGGGGSGCQAASTSNIFAGAGGGAGGSAIGTFAISEVSYPALVGQGGTGSTGAISAADGGSSSLNGIIATGGKGGVRSGTNLTTPGGAPGGATGGLFNLSGGYGEDGQLANYLRNGQGGASYWGGGGRAGASAGLDGLAKGSGGGGAYDMAFTNTAFKGGNGAPGVILLREYA